MVAKQPRLATYTRPPWTTSCWPSCSSRWAISSAPCPWASSSRASPAASTRAPSARAAPAAPTCCEPVAGVAPSAWPCSTSRRAPCPSSSPAGSTHPSRFGRSPAWPPCSGSWKSIFLGFHGGRGVATGVGGMLAIAPWIVPFALPVFVIIIWFTRYVSLASILGTLTGALFVVVFMVAGWIDPPGSGTSSPARPSSGSPTRTTSRACWPEKSASSSPATDSRPRPRGRRTRPATRRPSPSGRPRAPSVPAPARSRPRAR